MVTAEVLLALLEADESPESVDDVDELNVELDVVNAVVMDDVGSVDDGSVVDMLVLSVVQYVVENDDVVLFTVSAGYGHQ